MVDKEQLRLECLKLSVSRCSTYEEQIERADRFLVFVTEGKDGLDKRFPVSAPKMTAGKDRSQPGSTAEVGPKSS